MKIQSRRGFSPLLPPPPPPASFLPFSSDCGICQERKEEEGEGEKKKTGIEVNPFVNKAASESNFGEKRQSQHEGGAVKRQVQADESGTGEALGWRDQR